MSQQLIIISIVLGVLILFIWGRFRYDLVAAIGLLACVLTRVVKPLDAFKGFSHPATITVALVLILSYALSRSGVTRHLDGLVKKTTKRVTTHIMSLSFMGAALSMFINNIASLAIFMPIAMNTSRAIKRSPSLILMPLSFATILGGLITLIGTPPNIIIATYRIEAMGKGFKMFDFAPVGATIAIVGILYISVVGWRFVKVRIKGDKASADMFELEAYVSEIRIRQGSKLVGKSIKEVEELTEDLGLLIFSLIHNKQQFSTPNPRRTIEENDIIMVEGGPESIDKFVSRYQLEIISPEKVDRKSLHSTNAQTYEVVVPVDSKIDGHIIQSIHFRRKYNVNLLALSRQVRPSRGRLKDFKIKSGDVLLIHGEPEHVGEMVSSLALLPLAERAIEVGRRKYDWIWALTIFTSAILLASFNILHITISLTLAVVAMALFKIIPIREIYEKIDWPIIVLLGAMIPISEALESTGTTLLLAKGLTSFAGNAPPIIILGMVLVVTMLLTDILNNAATAIIMAPLGKLIAEQLYVNPDSFLMAVAVGASCAFLTPIGHQNNALIMGLGGYKFSDYWKLGLPLDLIIIAVAIPAIAHFWPLY